MTHAASVAITIYLVVVVVDVLLAWVQTDWHRWPRRLTHLLTEAPQAAIRRLLRPLPTGGWDLSPLVIVGALGIIRVWLNLP